MTDKYDKIFIIGFNKCGTRTLHNFFARSGLKSIHWGEGDLGERMILNAMKERKILDGYEDYRVFSDLVYTSSRLHFECNGFFRLMDQDYAGSAFIYNTRNLDDWITSRARHVGGRFLETYKGILATADENTVFDDWRRIWQQHDAGVRQYFAGRDDLLIFDIDRDDPQRIAEFLDMPLDLAAYEWLGKSGHPDPASPHKR